MKNLHTQFRSKKKWKLFRQHLLKIHNNTCQLCGATYKNKRCRQLQAHHLYPQMYDLLLPCLFKLICSGCHDLVERMYVKKDWGQYKELWHQLLDDFLPKKIQDVE